ncbi:MAG TPA: hypothetical protein DDZ80_28780 [Cyanobacteria bacterium UBA8803]|nr:hypothetical protein [Cyanobacteria bacterium UBA9273]HBL62251.1 hypothetical protein [Cyanobacteria bacterium UBA8803]
MREPRRKFTEISATSIGSIPIVQIAYRLEVNGYTIKTCLKQAGIESAQANESLFSRNFQSPRILAFSLLAIPHS